MSSNSTQKDSGPNQVFSDSSFLTSLDDNELIEFVMKLSQERRETRPGEDDAVGIGGLDRHGDVASGIQSVNVDQAQMNDPSTSDRLLETTFASLEDRVYGSFKHTSQSPFLQSSAGPNNIVARKFLPSSPILQRRRSSISVGTSFGKSVTDNDSNNFSVEPNLPKVTSSDTESKSGAHQLDKSKPLDVDISSGDDSDTEEVGPLHEFGDYETYFHNKQLKQQRADSKFIEWEKRRQILENKSSSSPPRSFQSQIFKDCTIHVNGHTEPGINEIHRLVILHGGRFLHYLGAKGNATHIICNKLTPKKRIEFARYKVVKPEWITKCIEANKLLPWYDFALINNDYGQIKLDLMSVTGGAAINDNTDAIGDIDNDTDQPSDKDQNLVQDDNDADSDDFELTPLTQEKEPPDLVNEAPHEWNDEKAMDARHPDFLPKFFARSRLHHLSTWKSDLRAQFLAKVLNSRNKSGSLGKSVPNMPLDRKVYIHVDFDCFFATASALNRPDVDIGTQPICVSHGGASADIASCNYVARKYGISNGMWLGSARKLCPGIICLDYDFPEYEKISARFYDILISSGADSVFPVSVDEALLDISSLCDADGNDRVVEVCQGIRDTILKETRCSASIGCGKNVLLAKLALRKAKPNGLFYLHTGIDLDEFLRDIPITNLPGIGRSIQNKLENELSISNPTVGSLRSMKKENLINLFGIKTGTKLFEYCRGIDTTSIDVSKNPEEFMRKSVSVDVNWGIRFDTVEQVDDFLRRLAKELRDRLVKIKMAGSSISLRLAKKAQGAPIEPEKYMGMGLCDLVTKSSRLGLPTNDAGYLSSEMKSLYRMVSIIPKDLRGIAVTMTKLVDASSAESNKQSKLPFARDSRLVPQSPTMTRVSAASPSKKPTISSPSQYAIPTDIDSSVLEALPLDIRDEISKKKDRMVHGIDWSVFNALPYDLKEEIKEEFSRRHISIGAKLTSPAVKKVTSVSPSKVYLQQLFPDTSGGSPKLVRIRSPVKESPKKKRKMMSPSPTKSKRYAVNSMTVSDPLDTEYDEDVLKELPSSIRNEVLQELQYSTIVSKFNLTPLREKLNKERTFNKSNNKEWVDNQVPLLSAPCLQSISNVFEIRELLSSWIMSTSKSGPHERDVEIFMEYILKLLEQNKLNRCMILLRSMEMQISLQFELSLDWNQQLNHVRNQVDEYCARNEVRLAR